MMNIRVIQPPYPKKPEYVGQTVSFIINELDGCSPDLDLILLPECCNAPCGCSDANILQYLYQEFTNYLYKKASETAMRCDAIVGINLYLPSQTNENKVRNSTILFGHDGTVKARYDKIHLPESEYFNSFIDHSYIKSVFSPVFVNIEGVCFSFITCYDVYFTEMINRISVGQPDVVLICSLQRAERHDILEVECKNCAFLCNAFVVRSSYFMGDNSQTGGCSMVCSPDGKIIENMSNKLGHFDVSIDDIHQKYMRSNGFGQPLITNYLYQTLYRAPWVYRAAGCGIVQKDSEVDFPRICADGGLSNAAPRDTLASVSMAVALGSDEVSIDLNSLSDGTVVVCPKGKNTAKDFFVQNPGKCFSEVFDGLNYSTFETYLKKFQQRTIFNLQINDVNTAQNAIKLLEKYDCLEHAYISSSCIDVLEYARGKTRTVFIGAIINKAVDSGCSGIQISENQFSEKLLDFCHSNGLRVTVCIASKDSQMKGVDCIMTSDILKLIK